jgi:hypothetical protein
MYLENGSEENNYFERNLVAFVHVLGKPAAGAVQVPTVFHLPHHLALACICLAVRNMHAAPAHTNDVGLIAFAVPGPACGISWTFAIATGALVLGA